MQLNRRIAVGIAALAAGGAVTVAPSLASAASAPATGVSGVAQPNQQPPGGHYPTEKWVHGYTFHTQANFYYCGPASTRLALTAQGVSPTQNSLAGSTNSPTQLQTNYYKQTPSIKLVTGVLNQRLSGSPYQTRMIGGNTASASQVAQLKSDMEYDFTHGMVIVANVVGTGKDTRGVSHSYSGGHYLDVVGYYDSGNRATIEDIALSRTARNGSGQLVRRYNMTTSALATWIASRGYSH